MAEMTVDNYDNDRAQAALERKMDRWKKELLDTGKRNRMINYRESRRQTLKILEPGAAELFNKLAVSEKTLTFQRPVSRDSDFRTYSMLALLETLSYSMPVQIGDIKAEGTVAEREKTLKNLRSSTRLAQEEQGTNILYLSFGFILWRENNKSSSQWLKSPLLMMPVRLERKSLNAQYTISKYDDEIEVNPTLDYVFNQNYGIDLPTFELKNKDSFEDYLEQIEQIIDKKGWKLVREVSLGLLSFLKISMYHDLNNNREQMINNPVIRAITGDRHALGELPAEAGDFNFDKTQPAEWHEVVDSDSSQEEAILLSKLGVSFVMQGPPGTGKSQTITNIIAEALGDGKKVLFVSEKSAALQVVLKRLTEARLDDFCLSLHNYKANKKEIIDNIGANLSLSREYVDSSVMEELTELFHDRLYLNEYAGELHKKIEPFGESVYEVFGKLAKLSDATAVEFKFRDPTKITKGEYASLLYLTDAFEKALGNMEGGLTDNPWAGTTATASGQVFKTEMMNATDGLAERLKELQRQVELLDRYYGCDLKPVWDDIREKLSGYEAVFPLPLFPAEWRDRNVRSSLRSRAFSEKIKDSDALAHTDIVRGLLEHVQSEWTLYGLSLKEEDLKQIAGEKQYEDTAGSRPLSEANERILSFIDTTYAETVSLTKDYREAAALMALPEGDTFSDIISVAKILSAAQNAPVMDAAWFDLHRNPEYLTAAEEAGKHREGYILKKQKILECWDRSVLDINIDEMLTRFRTRYTPDFYSTKERIDKDLEQLRIMHRSIGEDIEDSEIIDMLQTLATIRSEKTWFEENNSRLKEMMPSLYQGIDTDLENACLTIQRLMEEAGIHQEKIKQLTGQVLTSWEAEVLNIDASGMLNRFRTEYTGWLHKLKASYKNDMQQLKLLYRSVGTKPEEAQVIALLQTLDEIRREKQWFVDNEERIRAQFPIYLHEEDKERLKREVQKTIDEAKKHQAEFKEKTGIILEKWEKEVLDTDEAEILRRFREEYTGTYRTANELYKKDIYYLTGFSKRIGEEVSADIAAELLIAINDVNMEREWYSHNDARLKTVFKANYEGLDTDWDKVISGIRAAALAAGQIHGKDIPEETVRAVIRIVENPDKMPEIRRLSDVLTKNHVMNCEEAVRKALALTAEPLHESISNRLLTGLGEARNNEERLGGYIRRLDSSKKAGNVYWKDLKGLTDTIDALGRELQWFADNTGQLEDEAASDRRVDQLTDLAFSILRRYSGETTYVLSDELKDLFGDRYTGLDTDWQGIVDDIDEISRAADKGALEGMDGFLESVSNDAVKKAQAAETVRLIREVMDAGENGFDYFDKLFPSLKMRGAAMQEVVDKYNACLDGFDELNKWLDFVETKKECDERGLEDFTGEIVKRNNAIRDVRKAFERGFYTQWLSLAINDVPSVQTFRRRVHEQRLGRFVRLDEKQFEISRDRIRDRIISSFPSRDGVTKPKSQMGILLHEMEKKRRIMPLRRLFHEIPDLLLTLKPCLMMSPLSVAYFLNAGDYHFDMVIFDEASQIFPQDAIGAIFRADQVVIAGDTRQLPPTDFFSSGMGGNDDYDDGSEEGFEEEVYDSILEETASVLPNRTLLWHYRSRHEDLIAFSNREIYKNELITFPGSNESSPDTGVEFSFVEGGYYDRGARRNNILEAKRCVELVADHIKKYPERSLGIIAFSEAQQRTILNEIQKFREENPECEEFFLEDKEEAFFVKNLENVQGDERDTIILSICYARTKDQIANNKPMTLNFGPVMKAGGERRLNVAITRAKINIKLVSSILPSDIDLSRTTSEGIRMIRSYIEFAMSGGVSSAVSGQRRVPDDFAGAIYKFICDKGYKAKQYVGCSGYRIDIAVEHPEKKDEYAAGIECDGLSYVNTRTARDRDRLRASVLRKMGWNLYRVWSTEWYRNPEAEGKKLIEFIEKSISASAGRSEAALEETKTEKQQED
ncbi:MAG: DUF4011 domain-containing protein [Blautia sp.]|nr:DUF4011 domain-containing protein [Blautia sp.]